VTVYLHSAVLHPRHKLAYFKNANWEDSWVDTAERIVRDEFERSYMKDMALDEDGESPSDDEEVSTVVIDFSSRKALTFICRTPL
jgi:hypothetical protein